MFDAVVFAVLIFIWLSSLCLLSMDYFETGLFKTRKVWQKVILLMTVLYSGMATDYLFFQKMKKDLIENCDK